MEIKEIMHFTDAPELQHFAVEKVNEYDKAYGIARRNLVREYLSTVYSGEKTDVEVVSSGVTYKVLKRNGITAFYDAAGNTLFDVENTRLEKEYERLMKEDTETFLGSEEAETENSYTEKDSLEAQEDANMKADEDFLEEQTKGENTSDDEAGQSSGAENISADESGKATDIKKEPEKHSVIDSASAKLQEELQKAEQKEFAEPIIKYLMERCKESESLAADICQAHKTWERCFDYIYAKARKKATRNCAVIRDEVVYEWAEDYYHQEDKAGTEKKSKEETGQKKAEMTKQIPKARTKKKTKAESKTVAGDQGKVSEPEKSEKPKQKSRDMEGQMDLFSLMGM